MKKTSVPVYLHTPEVQEALQMLLSASLSLSNRVQEAHWNVKGANFASLHETFGDLYEFLTDAADLLAERIVQLGGQAIADPCGGPLFGDDMSLLVALKDALQELAGGFNAGIEMAFEDQFTSDIFVELGRDTEKWLWKITATTQRVVQV